MSTPIDHIQATIMFLRACGPVTKEQIAVEILAQVQAATKQNCSILAEKAVQHGIESGWIEQYDEESYCMA